MKKMTIKEMNNIEAGLIWAPALAFVAMDLGLIGAMVSVYLSYELNNSPKTASAGSGGGGAG